MRLPTSLAVALLLAPALAGCLGGSSGATTTNRPEPLSSGLAAPTDPAASAAEALAQAVAADPANATADAPAWQVGDAWEVTHGDGEGAQQSLLVVTAASGSTYTLSTNGEDLAAYDAMLDISYIGPIRASDLAGAQQGEAVKFFSFPLSDGKTWTARWDGFDIQLTATLNKAMSTPVGTQPGYEIVGTLDGTPYVTYDYVPALKWWSHLTFAAGYYLKVDRHVTNWTGAYLRATANPLLSVEKSVPVAPQPFHAFTVSEGQARVTLMLSGHTEKVARAMLLVDPAHQPVFLEGGGDVVLDPNPRREFVVHELPPTPGQWHLALAMLHDAEAAYHLGVTEIAFEELALTA